MITTIYRLQVMYVLPRRQQEDVEGWCMRRDVLHGVLTHAARMTTPMDVNITNINTANPYTVLVVEHTSKRVMRLLEGEVLTLLEMYGAKEKTWL